jgi:adenylosuccinate synthase
MFLYQTHKHPERQKDHLRQNSLRLQTTQEGIGTSQVDRRGRHTRLLRRRRHFHGQQTFKILINSTISIEDAAMILMDIKNYYLGTPLPRFEYMRMLSSRFTEKFLQKYNLNALAVDGWVHIEIRKGMYGLKQAGLLANKLMHTRLAPFG